MPLRFDKGTCSSWELLLFLFKGTQFSLPSPNFFLPFLSDHLLSTQNLLTMNAIGYTRISTEKQSEYSLDYQERLIREYCERHKLTLLAIFKDDGQSSYTFDRPDWIALENFIRQNKSVECLIVVDHDRFSRNLAEALMKIHELQAKYKIRVLATSDNFDTDFEDPSNFMIRAFKLMMAEGELHNIRKRTKNGIIQAALNGRFTNMAPYGYVNVRDAEDRSILQIDEHKAAIVRMIFREFLAGADIGQIARKAGEMGYKQRSNSAIQRILNNQVYYGMVPVPAYKGRKKPYVPGIHPAIISEQDFWLVQERLGTRKRAVHTGKDTPLRGALHCWCGRKMTSGNSRGKTGSYYWYYLCPEHRQNLSAVKLHDQFSRLLDAMSISEQRLEWLRSKLTKEIGETIQQQGDTLARLTKELKSQQQQIKATERKYLTSGSISDEIFRQVMAELKAEEHRLQTEIAGAGSDHQAYLTRLEELLSRLCRLREAFDEMTVEEQLQFINLGFDHSLSHDGETYRTRAIHPLLADKELTLKENGLLVVEKPVVKLGELPSVPGMVTASKPDLWKSSLQLLELIA